MLFGSNMHLSLFTNSNTMKLKHIFVAFTALLAANTANAQLGAQKITKKLVPTVTAGLKLGANLQQLSGDTPPFTGSYTPTEWNQSYKFGVLGGAFVSVSKAKKGIRVEGLVKTAKFAYMGGTDAYVKTVGLDIPVLFEFKPINRVWLQVGPQFTALISAKDAKDIDYKNQFRNTDVSLVAGVEVTLPHKLLVGGRYIYGLVNLNNTPLDVSWKSTSIQIYAGYRFIN